MKKKIEFKVMAWLRAVRERQAGELKGKSMEERLAYYRLKAQSLKNRLLKDKLVF